jgi:hypothetical protein
MLIETALRRPSRLPQAVSFALMHKHLHEYVRALSASLSEMAESLRNQPDSASLLPQAVPIEWNRPPRTP